MELKTYFARDFAGDIIEYPQVTVYEAGGLTLATGLQDQSGASLSNPFTGTASGKVEFAAPDGEYDLQVVRDSRAMTLRVQFLDVADQRDAAINAAESAATSAGLASDSAESAATSAGLASDSAESAATSAGLASDSAESADEARLIAEAARDAATVNANVYASTEEGLAAVTDGQQFQVVSADGLTISRYRRDSSTVATLVATYPSASLTSILLNAGKAYPIRAANRDGVTSAAIASVNNAFLDIKVIGARPGKLYRLEFIGNGTTALPGGQPNYEALFSEYEKTNYVSSSATGRNEVIKLGDIPATSIESGDVITRVFKSTRVDDLRFVVTYRPGQLPANGQVVLNSSGLAGYSWIIDESCYIALSDARTLAMADVKRVGVLGLNETARYPLKAVARDGATSAENTSVSASLLDIKVIGARPGKLYRLEFIGTGTTALNGQPNYEMLFTEYVKANYGSSSITDRVEVIKLYDIPATSIESGDVITRVFSSTRVPGIHFVVTYRPSALPAGQVSLNASNLAGYSWIIDESCYVPAQISADTLADQAALLVAGKSPLGIAWSLDSSELSVAFRLNDTHDLRLKVMRFGVNNIYNITGIAVAEHGGTPPSLSRTWTGLSSNGTDWIGPYHVAAVSGGDGGAVNFTGGTHGSTGGTDGSPTASHQMVEFVVDGRSVSGTASGLADEICVTWVNRVQGYNTKTTGREILEETISLRITAGCIEVQAEIRALEALSIKRYYGLQAQCGGFTSSVHMVGGQQGARFTPAASTDYTSGAFSTYPQIPAIVMRGDHGDFWMVIDYGYGFGAARAMDAGSPSAQYSQYGKAYHAFAYSWAGKAVAAGEKLPWRGAYAWGKNLSAGGICDSAARFQDDGRMLYRAVMNAAGSADINVKAEDKNRSITYISGSGDSRTGARATSVSSSGYGVTAFRLSADS